MPVQVDMPGMRDGESSPRATPAPNCAMVVFGAAGDLTHRLLIPAIYNLRREGLLPDGFAVLGVDREDLTAEAWRGTLAQSVDTFAHTRGTESETLDRDAWSAIEGRCDYLKGDFSEPATFNAIADWLSNAEREHGTSGNALFYLAVSDRFFAPIVEQLSQSGLGDQNDGTRWRRVIIEKPFGHDLSSAKALNRHVLSHLTEDQIYRIDHYLGKETVQNIMVCRFANGLFEPVWNRDHIDHIQITVAESVGVEHRAQFYERTGALRDMVPNHMFQLLSMTAMEPPNNFSAEAVRTEKVKVLDAARLWDGDCAVRGQYATGIINNQKRWGYRDEPDVAIDSPIETYVALKLMVDNWRWAGMPFYLRTGKSLAKRASEVVIQFKRAPFIMFRGTPVDRLMANRMTIHIQPDEGVSLQFGAKVPGPTMEVGSVSMSFKYRDYFASAPATGYETLVYECMTGDATLFQRADAVEAGWNVVQPLLDQWAVHPQDRFELYPAGSQGPRIADELLERDGRRWHAFA